MVVRTQSCTYERTRLLKILLNTPTIQVQKTIRIKNKFKHSLLSKSLMGSGSQVFGAPATTWGENNLKTSVESHQPRLVVL